MTKNKQMVRIKGIDDNPSSSVQSIKVWTQVSFFCDQYLHGNTVCPDGVGVTVESQFVKINGTEEMALMNRNFE